MGRSAIVLGGTGQIGRAVIDRLLAAGWTVTSVARQVPTAAPAGARFAAVSRQDSQALRRVIGDGADALIDVTAYDAEDGRQLLDLRNDIGALVVISSASVYRDAQGRTLDEAATHGFPELPDPIAEEQPTVAPGSETYSTRKIALECLLLDQASCPVTVPRPCAVHGVGSRHPREWWFVKRMLDNRPLIPLAFEGRSRFHATSTLNIAELVAVALDRPGSRVLNIADPVAPSVAEIGAIIGQRMNYAGRLVGMSEACFPKRIGRTPWSTPAPFVLDTRAAKALGYAPVADYAATAGAIIDDLVRRAAGRDWREVFPVLAEYPYEQFDYGAEDLALGSGP
jgi:nucleoside-diphosphate-sugar epimerase